MTPARPALVVSLLLGWAATACGWTGYRAFYGDLCWSPDGRRLAFTARYDADGAFFPDEAVVFLDVADSTSRPVVLTPPLHSVAVNDSLQLAAGSRSWGLTVVDLAEVKLVHSSPLSGNVLVPDSEGYATEWRDPEIEDLKWSPDGRRLAGRGYDAGPGTNILLGWQQGDTLCLQLATHCAGFCWQDDDTVLCRRTPGSWGVDSAESYVAVAVSTGRGRPASRTEYEAQYRGDVSVALPEGGWGPLRLGRDSIVFHHELGFGVAATGGGGFRLIRFPRNGHHPRWVSDSVLSFRVGRPGEEPLPFSVGWGDEERWQQPLEEELYCRDELWYYSTDGGRFRPAGVAGLAPVSRPVETEAGPICSPDGRLTARFVAEGRNPELVVSGESGDELRRVELRGLIP